MSEAWAAELESRRNKGLPNLPDSETIPIYLQIDTTVFNPEFLKGFGIEVISEEDEGFIIGASADGFQSLRSKINEFVNKNKAVNTAQLWQIVEGNIWRRNLILSKELSDRWDQIRDDENFLLEIGVACYLKLPDEPIIGEGESSAKFNKRHEKWEVKKRDHDLALEELIDNRTILLKDFVELYNGELLLDDFVTFPDSFCCRIKINGIGLKDLVNNFQYVFEINEAEELSLTTAEEADTEIIEATIEEPDGNSPKICVIDSGIMEGHKLLSPAIIGDRSISYVPNDASVADLVGGGGHGTKVAGAVLYGSAIPSAGDSIKLPFFLLNAKILDEDNNLSNELYPPVLMERISDDFKDAKIFNLSVASLRQCRVTHMSQWASAIDKIMYKKQILFIVATGNLQGGLGHLTNPGINQHLNNGTEYPEYLFENSSRIANPAQSSFALTVGSVCHSEFEDADRKSFGQFGDASAFTRAGFGLWGMIKPDVVEFGGDFIAEKVGARTIALHAETSPELVKKGAASVGKDDVGTSFSTPKVTHIAGILQKKFPDENALMYRALIVQSARHPNDRYKNPDLRLMQLLGYGVPDLKRATTNTQDRITFITDGSIAAKQAHVYKVNIPKQVQRPGYDYDILIEVTLSYFANPRRTRKGTRSYLSTWLEWESANLGESQAMFKERVIREMDAEGGGIQGADGGDGINWKIRNRKNNGVQGVRRQDGTLQKDWSIIKSNQLPDEFCIAVIGHKGWETETSSAVPYALTISFEVLTPENEIELYQLMQAVNIEVEVQPAVQVTLF
ncbi:MAG: hypothetical protein A3F72_19245 [Bacteroidetes bacterium RIFCSPLOWO2_12_FULL_35_15]|nr:MAG: hypothetical protein A3F72_19245 [Bacteroidetes bacterium RIFCSPLOWO2_12_FULL_35_15]